jgi:hypothetical protein
MYVTTAELRALNGLGNAATHPDAVLEEAAALAKILIDDFCGTSFGDVVTPSYEAFTVTVDGSGSDELLLRRSDGSVVMFPRTIDAVTIDGDAVTDVYSVYDSGKIRRHDGVFDFDADGLNVTVTGTAGFSDSPPLDIRVAARAIARDYALDLVGRMSDRVLSSTSAVDGSYEVKALSGGLGRPTALPEVNTILNRNKHTWRLG